MKFTSSLSFHFGIATVAAFFANKGNVAVDGQMVKMCLFYNDPAGHARSDPIINQECASDHIHTVRYRSNWI